MGLMMQVRKLTVKSAIEGTQVSVLRTVEGDDFSCKLIYTMLDDVRAALMIPNSQEQEYCLATVAIRIVIEYWFLKVEELLLCFENVRAGRYGKSYHKLSEEEIMQWLVKYDMERTEHLHNEHEGRKYSWGSNADRTSQPEAMSAGAMIQKLVDEKVEQRISAYKKTVEQGKQE